MRVLVDINVVLDVLLRCSEWLEDAEAIWESAAAGRLECCLAASSVTDIFYIVRRGMGAERARAAIGECLGVFTILDVTGQILKAGHARSESDFEDAVVIATALEHQLDGIVSRDLKGFADSPIRVWTPRELNQHLAHSGG